ncbi:MAG TPA: FAD-dependent oxidoreductase [Pseudonocardia sp.]
MTGSIVERPAVAVVGGGPAGLTAAANLAGRVDGEVLVLDRETAAGGIPRHSDHTGYGIRDKRSVMRGPDYARRLVREAVDAGALLRTSAMVTGWSADGALEVTSPDGRYTVNADAVVLATGARERPRTARLIPGDRPHGVLTTGQLQNLVHLHHRDVGKKAVVVGAELVSWSAVVTLRETGCSTALMVTHHDSPESYAAFNLAGRFALRTPIATSTRVTRIIGKGVLEGVEIEDLGTRRRRVVECDTVVFTGDWIPDHELARSAGLDMDPATRGPRVDTALRTSKPGVFAVGNLLHPVDTADIAALDGRHVAQQVVAYLDGARPAHTGVSITAAAPFRWVAPHVLRPGDPPPPRGRMLLWTDELIRTPRVSVQQDGQTIVARRMPWPASPGRVFRIPSSMLDDVDRRGGTVTIGVQ